MPEVGRNEPCPCGSGRKYKHCHGRLGNGAAQSEVVRVNQEVAEELAKHEFASLEEVQAHLDSFMHKRNSAPLPEFHGLSPNDMTQLMYAPLDSPELLTLPEVLDVEPSTTISDLFMFMAETLLANGSIKLTAKGNLPRAICQAAAERFDIYESPAAPFSSGIWPVNREDDFKELQVTRIVAVMAGLVRKYHGRLSLTRKGTRLLENHGARGIYPPLFRAFVEKYNWGYVDRYPDLALIQRTWAFTALLLTRYGNLSQPGEFYSDQFVRAFPTILAETQDHPFGEPIDTVSRCYTTRALERFAQFLGLIRVEFDGPSKYFSPLQITALPLLRDAVRFNGRLLSDSPLFA